MIGLGISIPKIAVNSEGGSLASLISSLFKNNEQGVWYDPSDMSTMFQDPAGTTPVTAVEQPVGLILDKSRGLVLGPELVTNGDFSNGTTGWTATIGSIANVSGTLRVSNTGTFGRGVSAITTVANRWYKITAVARYVSGEGPFIRATTSSDGAPTGQLCVTKVTTSSTFSALECFFLATGATTYIVAIASAADGQNPETYFDNISVRELPGFHATQTTTTSRPVLSARVNLLTATETLATQTVTTRATTQTLRFEGAGTITLSGAATGTYSAGSHSITTTAGNLTLTVSGTVTKADLRAANMGVGLPAYQRVNTATDYDTAGFPMYLRFDGVDDWLVTPSIDFTTINNISVFAGVRKLSDAARGIIVEQLTLGNVGVTSFGLSGPQSNSATTYAAFISAVSSANVAAPSTNVLTGLYAPKELIAQTALKVNGGVGIVANGSIASSVVNHPIFIGRRGGTSLPFNGHLYSLIVRGAQSTAQQIANAEKYVAIKTGFSKPTIIGLPTIGL